MGDYEKSISKSKTTGTVSPKLIRLFALYENLLNFALPLASGIPGRQYPETPVSQSNNIVDISGVGLKQFWNLKQHMQDASTLATAHYPETLDRIFVSLASPACTSDFHADSVPDYWSTFILSHSLGLDQAMVSQVEGPRGAQLNNFTRFDPITVSKIFILAQHEVHPTLAKYVDESCIPKKYGGKLNWEWGQAPAIEPAIINAMKWEGARTFPTGPVRFEQDKAGNLIAYAVGSENGQRRHAKIATLPAREDVTTLAVHPALSRTNTQAHESSGWHTHPTAGQQTMPTSGHTPPNHSPEIHPMVTGGSNGASEQQRAGASFGRFDSPGQTNSSGQYAESRPVNTSRQYQDAHTTYNPSTVGQAPKAVDLPHREASQGQDTSYLGQAKAALNSAVVAAEGAEEAVLERLGYGHKQETQPQAKHQEEVADDPRVDSMPRQSLEDYLRSQTADYDRPGHHR